ncbi:PIG-L family deacetylase [Metabacillus idriensis]|uniref:PIG-L family deacetylase n=1 Tax=Metabacillus idriensis TaxID=324768 RepID=A0A6I2MDK5_9BACI|nr:PIG-L family deacetylase [Metabacillus idriensis]MCM3596565.1 PIG-L family deacetylase [Metabacillus idriensis]MRX55352.1 PIG-L family deacetylase [Metabacillus idriensis]OHR68138.1 GlcNAc-PI de-N-acetylase [Bacillus sp. HMSC76G11]
MSTILVIAPHPDDETLGCGGALLRHKKNGDSIHWLIVTAITAERGFTKERIEKREMEITQAAALYEFDSVTKLGFPTARLDTVPLEELVQKIGETIQRIRPDIVYLPHPGDIHSDHKFVFDSGMSCTKWFRYPFVKRILVYETLSETELGINPAYVKFSPNVYVDITSFLDQKIEIMKVFQSEMGEFPFPRSEQAIRALSSYRGASSGFQFAEGYILIKEVI